MSAFVFGTPISRTLTTHPRSTFISPLDTTTTFHLPKVSRRGLSMVLDRPRRHRGGSLWGPTSSSFGDLMWPERMMSRFFEPFGDIMQGMGEDGIIEEDNQYKIKMLMPGVQKENIKVDVKGDVLNIRVEKDTEEKGEENEQGQVEWVRKQMHRVNRSYRVPDNADLSNVKAVTKDGILTVTMPKTDKEEPSKVIDVAGE